MAYIVVDGVLTPRAVLAGLRGTLIDIDLAVFTLEARWTRAEVVEDQVLALAAVQAGLCCALVDVDLAVRAGVAVREIEDVAIDAVIADGPVLTRRRGRTRRY